MAGIYVHIPFCKSKCAYCNFFSQVSEKRISDYVTALKREIVARKSYLGNDVVNTIYFGGGTPSLLPIESVDEILDLIHRHFNVESHPEITLEVNPDTIKKSEMFLLKKLNVNRISLGIQSFFDDDLHYLSRKHDSRHALQIIDDLHDVGFEKMTLDLIYGIPTLTEEKWNKNLDIFFSTGFSHLSAYALTVEPNTILGHRIRNGELKAVSEDEIVKQYQILVDRTKKEGFEHYEISNFAKPNCRSRHNVIYWTDEKYLGLGPSAHSYDTLSRQWNISNLSEYIEKAGVSDEIVEKEWLDINDKYNEYVMTALRTSWGCSMHKISRDYGAEYLDHFLKCSKKYLKNGTMISENSFFFLSEKGKLFADGIAADLFL